MFSQYLCTVQILATNFIGYVILYLYIKLLAPIVVYKSKTLKHLLTLINDETRVKTKDARVDIFR